MEKYIWMLKETEDRYNVDEVHKFVVMAEDEEKARSVAAEDAMDEGANFWKDPKKSSCKKIGIAFDLEMDIISKEVIGL